MSPSPFPADRRRIKSEGEQVVEASEDMLSGADLPARGGPVVGNGEEVAFVPSRRHQACDCAAKVPIHISKIHKAHARRRAEAVDRTYRKYAQARERLSLRDAGRALLEFARSDMREKVETLFQFKKVVREIVRQGKRFGPGFVAYTIGSFLCDDIIVPAILYALKLNWLATIVLFGHFEWATIPAYFLFSSVFRKSLKRKMKPKEYEALMARVRDGLDEEATYHGRQEAAHDFVRHFGPFVARVFRTELRTPYDPAGASSVERIGAREQATKFLGKILPKIGLSSDEGAAGFECLKRMVNDPDPFVRNAALAAFAGLEKQLARDSGRTITAYGLAVRHLHRGDGGDAFEPEGMVRGASAYAMRLFPSDDALDHLAQVIADPIEDPWAKRFAALSAAEIGKERRLHPGEGLNSQLENLLNALEKEASFKTEPQFFVREAMVEALGVFPKCAFSCAHHKDYDTEISAVLRSVLMEDPDPKVRESALWGYARRAMVNNSSLEEVVETLYGLLDDTDRNLAGLAVKFLELLRTQCKQTLPDGFGKKVAEATAVRSRVRPLRLIAVDALYDPEIEQEIRKLDSRRVQDFVASLRSAGHTVFYSRNFFCDRSTAPMREDGSIDTFHSFNTGLFEATITKLRSGRVARIPWMHFDRGRVEAERIILPNPKGAIIVVGSKDELERLGGAIGVPDEHYLDGETFLLDGNYCTATQIR